MKLIIDIPEYVYKACLGHRDIVYQYIANGTPYEERSKGECKSCRHRDPEDKKCDCGGLERAGCYFPVSDDYYCKYYERRTWDAEMEANDE